MLEFDKKSNLLMTNRYQYTIILAVGGTVVGSIIGVICGIIAVKTFRWE